MSYPYVSWVSGILQPEDREWLPPTHTRTQAHTHTSTQIEHIKMEWRDSAACCHKQWACDGHYQQAVRAKYNQLFECVNVCSPHPHTNASTLINSDMPTHTHTKTQRHKNSFPLQWMRHDGFHTPHFITVSNSVCDCVCLAGECTMYVWLSWHVTFIRYSSLTLIQSV